MDLTNNMLGFGAGEACELSGIAFKRLDYWARSGFITPSVRAPEGGNKARRRYSFRDVVELTVVRKLRDIGFSLQALRQIQKILRRDYHAPFAQAWLISDGHDVFELCKKKADIVSVLRRPGQLCLPTMVLDVGATAQELMELAAAKHQTTIEEIRECISHSPNSLHPKQQKRHVVTV
jgi:DNA-binding transcriptional MerR regulator